MGVHRSFVIVSLPTRVKFTWGPTMENNKSETPPLRYRPSIVTFIDILGFGSIVKKKSSNEIYQILKRVQRHAGSNDKEILREFGLVDEASWTRCVFFPTA